MQRTKLSNAECPIARSLDEVGEWWSMLLMRDALQGLRRFDEFSQSLGIAPNMLTRRLTALVEAGMLERVPWHLSTGEIAITPPRAKAFRWWSDRAANVCN